MKNFLLTLFIVFASCFSYAQQNETEDVELSEDKDEVVLNAYKFDFLQLITGRISFAYERVFNYNNGVEIVLGPTISGYGFDPYNWLTFLDLGGHYPSFKPNVGGFVSLAYKRYVLKNRPGLNGLFIAPRLQFSNYRANVYNKLYYGYDFYDGKSISNFHHGLVSFEVGMNHTFRSGVGLEYFLGVGLAFNWVNWETVTWEDTTDPVTGEILSSYDYLETRKDSYLSPNLRIGFKLYLTRP